MTRQFSPFLVSRTPRVCWYFPLLAPRSVCSGLPAGALQPVRPSSPGWLSNLRSPGSAVCSLVSSAGISPGKKGPSILTFSLLSLLSSGAVRLRTPPWAGEAAPAESLDSHKSDVPSCSLFPSDHHSQALGPTLTGPRLDPRDALDLSSTLDLRSCCPQKAFSSWF